MIPWRLSFSGIRDYPSTAIDLSGEQEDIVIMGPNGVGKSTLTFCIGAVLYSGKVEIEGLRSKNLSSDETWQAAVEFLFHNMGPSQVDAAKYVQFSLFIEQKPHQPIGKSFVISEGDQPGEWDKKTVYKSGDKGFNFSEYRYAIKNKYRVDPDDFYLIWYQNQVNQFSDMYPQERFRIFSEMNEIDKIQKAWEESKVIVTQADESLKDAEVRQQRGQLNLGTKKEQLNRYLERNRLMESGLKGYGLAKKVLDYLYHEELTNQWQRLEQWQQELDDYRVELDEGSKKIGILKEQINFQEKGKEQLHQELTDKNKEKNNLTEKKDRLDIEKSKIELEISHIKEEISKIPYSSQEVYQTLTLLQEDMASLKKRIQQNKQKNGEVEIDIEDFQAKVSKLEYIIEHNKELAKEYQPLLKEFGSSRKVSERIEELDQEISRVKEEISLVDKELTSLQEEHRDLTLNRIISQRQKEALVYCEQNQVQAFPLREFLTLDDKASLEDEKRLDAIKYTIFINSRKFIPQNDLYYVSLPEVVPEKFISHLPELHLKVRGDLQEDLVSQGVKALWWVKTFFGDEQPRIKNGILVDPRGRRGMQEKKTFILSEMALKKRKEETTRLLNTKTDAYHLLGQCLRDLQQEVSKFRNALSRVNAAETFINQSYEREVQEKELQNFRIELRTLQDEGKRLKEEWADWNSQFLRAADKKEEYGKYQKIYDQYEQESDKIQRLQDIEKEIEDYHHQIQDLKRQINVIERSIDQTKQGLGDLNNQWDQQLELNNRTSRNQEALQRKWNDENDLYLLNEEHLLLLGKEYKEMNEYVGEQWRHFLDCEEPLPNWTKAKAKSEKEQGEGLFRKALNMDDIDEAAPENYENMKIEYDRSRKEVDQAKILLMENEERMAGLKKQLEDTVTLKIAQIRQLFVHYMGLFGFAGAVEWEMSQNKQGQMTYYLYLKARKEGHQGSLEEVSEKGRGNRFGKGLSGGERSLVSLLFALALLQSIKLANGFIVLDEFDSALDEGRKATVFDLYKEQLDRKMIILTPRSHDEDYLSRFSKAYVIYHDPMVPESRVFKVHKVVPREAQLV